MPKEVLEYYWKNVGDAKNPKWIKTHTVGWLKAHPQAAKAEVKK